MVSIDPEAFEPEGEEHQDREAWRITDGSAADWALRKLSQARRQITDNEKLYEAEKERLKVCLEDANKGHERDVEYFESVLRNWHEEQLDDDPKRKTISLPGGKLQARQNPDHVEIEDAETFTRWALENHSSWVRVEYKPEKDAIKKAGGVVPETGEIAPGVTVVPGELRWKAVTE
jgi:phage host-nuclease inhibitor protein Gam